MLVRMHYFFGRLRRDVEDWKVPILDAKKLFLDKERSCFMKDVLNHAKAVGLAAKDPKCTETFPISEFKMLDLKNVVHFKKMKKSLKDKGPMLVGHAITKDYHRSLFYYEGSGKQVIKGKPSEKLFHASVITGCARGVLTRTSSSATVTVEEVDEWQILGTSGSKIHDVGFFYVKPSIITPAYSIRVSEDNVSV